MASANILVTVRQKNASRFTLHLAGYEELRVRLVRSLDETLNVLADRSQHIDLLVLDNGLSGVFELVADLRQTYPRLLIVLVDEAADFAMPGQADDISTDPFTDDDLVRRISRLISDRHLETLRADAMPPVRDLVKKLRKAVGEAEKLHAAVGTCLDLEYDYVAIYRLENLEPLEISLQAQEGAPPLKASPNGIVAWVAKSGQSRIAVPNPDVNPRPTARLGAVACTSIGMTNRYGVLVACRVFPNAISQPEIKLLEMVSAQLAAALSKE